MKIVKLRRFRVRGSALALPTIVIATVLLVAGCSSSGGHSSTQAKNGSSGGSSPTKTSGCPTGTASGATSSQVSVATTIIDISGGSLTDATVGVPSTQTQETYWRLVADSINNSGGAGCRKIVLHFYPVNPVDAAAAQQSCLDIATAKPYIVLDTGALTEVGASNCIPAHHIVLASSYLTLDELNKYRPYYLQIGDIPEDVIHNGILGLHQLGYFSAAKGFKKLGILYHNCTPVLYADQLSALKAAGVTNSQIVSYNLGCPAGQSDTAASMEQAVLSFKNAGVTDVTEVNLTDYAVFTQVAQQQNYKPQYVFDDNDLPVSVKSGTNAPDPANLDGAVDVTGTSAGEQNTPGYNLSGASQKCNSIYTAAGQPDLFKQADNYGGVVCEYLTFVQVLLGHSISADAADLVTAMHSIGNQDFSFPGVPIDFSAAPAGSAYGVSDWRPVYYHASCQCWQVGDPNFNQPFK